MSDISDIVRTAEATGRNTALICLGSNTADADVRLSEACRIVTANAAVTAHTPPYRTADEYAAASGVPYLNQLLLVSTTLDLSVLHRIFKEYEAQVRPCAVAPAVAIDIDIVVWNDTPVKPRDLASDYLRQGLTLLAPV